MSGVKGAILAVGRVLDRAFGWETPPPRLTGAQVLQIARAAAEEQGWPWVEGEQVLVGFNPGDRHSAGVWDIFTNANYRGGNITMQISDGTGAVIHKGFAPY